MVEVTKIDTGKCRLLLKLESQNPGGSIKDRIAVEMLDAAEREGWLKEGGTIVEATAGNTGLALTLVGRARGYKVLLVIPDKMSKEKIQHLRAMGADVRLTRSDVPHGHPEYYTDMAERLAQAIPGAYYVNQFANQSNADAHVKTTGPEIWAQTDGKVDGFICAVGSGGTLAGVAQALRAQRPDVKIGLADPYGAALYSYYTTGELKSEGGSISEGIGQGRITANLEGLKVDHAYRIADDEMLGVIYDLVEHEGLVMGGSTGVNVAGAIRMAKDLGPGHTIVTILCDQGARYQSKIFNKAFLTEKGLPTPAWL